MLIFSFCNSYGNYRIFGGGGHHEGGGGGFGDFFGDFFGERNAGKPRTNDVKYQYKVSLQDMYKGVEATVNLND